VNVIGAVPVHVPVAPFRVSPSRAVPAIDGGAVLTGGAALTVVVAAVVAEALPAAFVAVTTARIVRPVSAAVRR
jgi:hypothetical protein